MKRLIFTVTNDLLYDQRMIRICTSLHRAGYRVTLIGRRGKHSKKLFPQPFFQKRICCFFNKGKLFYIEYNIRLLCYLLFKKMDLIGAIDLDTIGPCYIVSRVRNKKRIYDAHELFCEMKEVVSRPSIYKVWKWIERKTVPDFPKGYTVNNYIQSILLKDYGVNYAVIRNIPLLKKEVNTAERKEKFILYQGAVNHGRSFETLIPAFQWIDVPLWICGNGNFYEQAVALAKEHHLENKVLFKGTYLPDDLRKITLQATLGITIFENKGLSNYYSLANRFFDYMHAGVPQVCVDYPAYREINDQHKVAVLIDDLSPESIAATINETLQNENLMQQMHEACLKAREAYNWQKEEEKVVRFYHRLFH